MPLYAYRCTECGHRFEKIQNFSAEPETECPKCQGKLERPLTAPSLQFKGAGWYVNDYAPKSASSSGDSASGDGKPAESKPSETKPSETKSAGGDGSSAAPAAPAANSTPAAGSGGSTS